MRWGGPISRGVVLQKPADSPANSPLADWNRALTRATGERVHNQKSGRSHFFDARQGLGSSLVQWAQRVAAMGISLRQ